MATGSGIDELRTLSPKPRAKPLALSGCQPVPVSRAEIAGYEGAVEYWDADTEIVWKLHESSSYHEGPRGRLVEPGGSARYMRGEPTHLLDRLQALRTESGTA